MEKKVPGYGDVDCYNCKITLNPEMADLCNVMVFYTRQQERCARMSNWAGAIFWENKQNQLALLVLKCKPGTDRV